ncbi:hypothetical protein GCM10011374_36380 [Kocuria dechangensis]|uniref:Uncharacterized protein n=1 Tax=Kocuria dechangensis TaxID=1176249 RepID=A0A917M174_9MICC|nr:hypothetical protein [Kocuria dechangensis]GGG68692.1 hypothetical protein GCM10011374_36380 [Kocuria dechangensis]
MVSSVPSSYKCRSRDKDVAHPEERHRSGTAGATRSTDTEIVGAQSMSGGGVFNHDLKKHGIFSSTYGEEV